MHELVTRIKDPDLCHVFARNANRQGRPELALEAVRRAVDLRAEQHEVDCDAERSALRAIYAYEAALSHKKGKRTRATGTWQLVSKHGVLIALGKRLDSRGSEDINGVLKELGMEDYSFEAVHGAYPEAFATAA